MGHVYTLGGKENAQTTRVLEGCGCHQVMVLTLRNDLSGEGFCLHGLSLGLDEAAGAPSSKNSGILCIFLPVSHLPPLWMTLLLT